MIPCIGMAVSVRVGHALGRNDLSALGERCYAMLLVILIATIATIAVVGTRFEIAELFVCRGEEPPYSSRSFCGTQVLFNKRPTEIVDRGSSSGSTLR
ncbi:hypothetical protein ACVWY3_004752 [Bradyrhizobium sp. USDA 4486]